MIKKVIESYLRKDVDLHIYSIGDLDDFFWPYTIWYGLESHGDIDAVVLIYVGLPIPSLLAFSNETGVMEVKFNDGEKDPLKNLAVLEEIWSRLKVEQFIFRSI